MSDDVRPFFGEEEEVLSAPTPAPVRHERRGTFEQRRQWWIAEGACPRPGCHVELDEGCCPQCGWTLADEKPAPVTVEQSDDYVPTLQLALTLDEYAEANP